MAPPSRSGSRPGRALAALAVLILVMLISITGSQTFNPGNWHKQFKVGLGLDLSSGTQVVLKAQTANGAPSAAGPAEAEQCGAGGNGTHDGRHVRDGRGRGRR